MSRSLRKWSWRPADIVGWVFRRISPKRYCRWKISQLRQLEKEELRALGFVERKKTAERFGYQIHEWAEWLEEMEDAELVAKARSMDIELDDLPIPPADSSEDDGLDPHYEAGNFGNRLLRQESYRALKKAMRERALAYRKEQRERVDLWLKVCTILTGLVGATTGLVALLKK